MFNTLTKTKIKIQLVTEKKTAKKKKNELISLKKSILTTVLNKNMIYQKSFLNYFITERL